MAYEPTDWQNREVEKPRTYIMTDNGDGTITLTPSEGQVFAPGTPLDASNLNKMEEQIALNDENKVNRDGDTMTGVLNGTIINATTLQQGGINLDNKYQNKGSYQTAGQYPYWQADPNGCSVVVGNYNQTGKPIRVFFTSAQPGASSAEHRVWIQIDNF